MKFVNYSKLLKMHGTGCYNINVIFMSSQKDALLKYVEFGFWHTFSFFCIWKYDGKVFGKITGKSWPNFPYMVNAFAYMVNAFVFHYVWQLRLLLIQIVESSARENAKK